jgi:hypothetical protein
MSYSKMYILRFIDPLPRKTSLTGGKNYFDIHHLKSLEVVFKANIK